MSCPRLVGRWRRTHGWHFESGEWPDRQSDGRWTHTDVYGMRRSCPKAQAGPGRERISGVHLCPDRCVIRVVRAELGDPEV